jgi:Phosphotransferase enzyme family
MSVIPDFPASLLDWCGDVLCAVPVRTLFVRHQASSVYGVELSDRRALVLKLRRDDDGRAAACVEAQRHLAAKGFPCATPVTGVSRLPEGSVHAETYLPGGTVLVDDGPAAGIAFATVFAEINQLLADGIIAGAFEPPPVNPDWVRWNEPEPFPLLWWQPDWVLEAQLPELLTSAVDRIRRRLKDVDLPLAVGHADFETQNVRWQDGRLHAVHDWDSLAYLPEAALVGVAGGTFASNGTPTLAPLGSSAAFIESYQHAAGRRFSREETEVAWAASLWPACYNARTQLLWNRTPLAVAALQQQAAVRLRLAGC